MVLDATRERDGCVICIKRVVRKSNEVEIGRYLSSGLLAQNSNNHCVEISDFFSDPSIPEVQYIVMPALRPYNDPEFGAIGEVEDFVTQVLEVRVFFLKCLDS